MKDKRFNCEYCTSKFTEKKNMLRHMSTCKSRNKKSDSDTSANNGNELILTKALVEQLKEQNELLKQQLMLSTVNHIVNNNGSINTGTVINNNVNVVTFNVLDKLDINDHLSKELGIEKAQNYIKSMLYRKLDGELDCFIKIYLQGSPEKWSIRCLDSKKLHFQIIQKDGKVIDDIGGNEIYKSFTNNLIDTYTRASNNNLNSALSVIKHCSDDEERENMTAERDNILDQFDMRAALDRCIMMRKKGSGPFMTQLAIYMKNQYKTK